jgi:hypothetical protein
MTDLRRHLYAPTTSEALIVLVTLTSEGWTGPIRVAQWPRDVVSRGETFMASPVAIVLPESSRDGLGTGRVALRFVTGELVALVRTVEHPIRASLEIVRASDPDVVELPAQVLDISEISYSASDMEMSLAAVDLTAQRYPEGQMGPALFPGISR